MICVCICVCVQIALVIHVNCGWLNACDVLLSLTLVSLGLSLLHVWFPFQCTEWAKKVSLIKILQGSVATQTGLYLILIVSLCHFNCLVALIKSYLIVTLILISPLLLWPPVLMHTSIHFFPRTIRGWNSLDTLSRSQLIPQPPVDISCC